MFDAKHNSGTGYFQRQPQPGNWYVDRTGALFKVKALVFEEGKLDHAIVDYPRGPRRKVLLSLWRQFIYQANMPTKPTGSYHSS